MFLGTASVFLVSSPPFGGLGPLGEVILAKVFAALALLARIASCCDVLEVLDSIQLMFAAGLLAGNEPVYYGLISCLAILNSCTYLVALSVVRGNVADLSALCAPVVSALCHARPCLCSQ